MEIISDRMRTKSSGRYAFSDDTFSNLLEHVATSRPNIYTAGFEEDNHSARQGHLDDERHYNTINGKFGIFAELASIEQEKSSEEL